MFTSPISPQMYQELMKLHSSRRLLIHDSVSPTSNNPVDPTVAYSNSNGFDANMVMVLSVLLCALICSLGLNAIVKCALRCSRSRSDDSDNPASDQLANKGIKKKALKSFAVVNYSADLNLPGLDTECVICLSEFAAGDKVRLLPRCNHGFHTKCIDKWLNSHSSCPTCRHCLIDTCHKIVGSDNQPSSSHPQPESQIVNMTPLEREDLVRAYRCSPL